MSAMGAIWIFINPGGPWRRVMEQCVSMHFAWRQVGMESTHRQGFQPGADSAWPGLIFA
jgi:hypothetical protein